MILRRVSKQVERKGLATTVETACLPGIPRRDGDLQLLLASTDLHGGNPFNSLENKLQLHLDKGTHTKAREVSIFCEKLLWGRGSGQDRRLKVLSLWLFLRAASMPSGLVGAKTKEETQRNRTWERTSKRAGISNGYRHPPNKRTNNQPSKETRNAETNNTVFLKQPLPQE